MKRYLTIGVGILAALGATAQIQVNDGGQWGPDSIPYKEKYRPQYHYTPLHRWIGDPSGLVKFGGKYKAYGWGAAETDDLVHWKELNRMAITGLPEGQSAFTGSVVVDTANTSGWGKDTYVAAFTNFERDSKKQAQSVAFSHDSGLTYQCYDLNPVIDTWSTEFRDPTVIRYAPTGKWVMAVAKALNKKVAFYESDNLRDWVWTSDFGPMGDNEKSWECPDLFQVTVEETGEKKWVLLVSVNWAREQYFVGDFDGREFIPERKDAEPLYVDHGLDYYASRTFQNYDPEESPVYSIGWVNTWDYAPTAPMKWGKGIWSLPRELTLYETPDGHRLRQRPAKALESLRGKRYARDFKLGPGTVDLKAVAAMDNQYELQLRLRPSAHDVAGVNLCVGDGRKVRLSYDAASGYLTIDRTNSTDASIPKFERMAYAQVGRDPMLRIFVDKSTVEIFANDGEKAFSLLSYAAPSQTGVELFSEKGRSQIDVVAWPLASIWQ